MSEYSRLLFILEVRCLSPYHNILINSVFFHSFIHSSILNQATWPTWRNRNEKTA